jgi:hypothetical protein
MFNIHKFMLLMFVLPNFQDRLTQDTDLSGMLDLKDVSNL